MSSDAVMEELPDEILVESDQPVKREVDVDVNLKIELPDEEILDSLTLAGKIDPYKEKVNKDPFDQDSWLVILFEIQSKPIESARPYWEEFLKIYPTAGRYWKTYVEQEILSRNYENAENIFRRCLKQCPHVDLWRTYLKYILDTKGHIPELKSEITQAFELSIRTVGMDLNSTPIWTDYIKFIKSSKTLNQMEDGFKMEQLRKLYQRAVINPMQNLESIWKEYDAFENALNKVLARNLIQEHSSKYMQARATYRERKNYLDGLQRNMLARPPRYLTKKDANQVHLWKRLVVYEKQNPQKLSPELLRERVTFTYNQCLMCLYHFPEIWHEAAQYQLGLGNVTDAITVYREGLNAIKESVLLSFSFADFLESHGHVEQAKDVYEKILPQNEPLVYIQYMRFTRRSIGVKEARNIFYRARKSPKCTYQVYVAAAEIELHANENEEIARHVFELGFKKFMNEMGFLLEYVNFLFRLNDKRNIRNLFEKIISEISVEQAPEIWNAYLKFERLCGNLSSLTSLENRRADIYPEVDPNGILALVQRFRFLDLWPCSQEELASFEGGHRAYKAAVAGRIAKGEELPTDRRIMGQQSSSREKITKPDLSKMVLFNPESIATNMTLANGETLAVPAVLAQFFNTFQKPSTGRWEGPVVNIDGLLQSILENHPKKETPKEEARQAKKRTFDSAFEADEGQARASVDIFKERQAQKLQKQQEATKVRR